MDAPSDLDRYPDGRPIPTSSATDHMRGRGVILWDFDGTLATRDGMWSGALIEALDQHSPGHGVTLERVRPHMRHGFPWHSPEVPHLHLTDAESWWQEVRQVFSRALRALGVPHDDVEQLSVLAQARYVDPTVGWRLFDDTADTLERARQAGWSNQVLSNHVPELPDIIEHLGLGSLLDAVHNSAVSGYEKPNPKAFALALSDTPLSTDRVWMVGDNPIADVEGAHGVGVRAILVRSQPPDSGSVMHAENVSNALSMIEALSRS